MENKVTAESKRDQLTGRLKNKYPDRNYVDDEALFGQINEDYDDYDNQLNGYKEREGKLTDLFRKNPSGAEFLTDMAKGKDPWLAVINRLGIEGVTDLINDPSKQEAYAEENQKYVERLAKSKKLDEEYEKNIAKSLETLSNIQQKQKLSDEAIDAAYDLVMKIANDAVLGIVSEETIGMALKAVNHDNDVKTANEEGIVAGKNSKIEEKLRKPKYGDGTPNLGGANNAPTKNIAPKKKNIFDVAKDAL